MSVLRKKDAHKRNGLRTTALEQLCGELRQHIFDLPSFGPELGSLSGSHAADVVVSHRILSKFQVPVPGNDAIRRSRTILQDLASDNGVVNPQDEVYHLARLRLKHWFRGFRPTYRFVAPSGASAASYDTDDVFEKLRDLNQWEVSPECLDYSIRIAYNNNAIKQIVRAKFREEFPYMEMHRLFRAKHGANGYSIFSEMFKSLVTYNSVARIEVVPKNNDIDRMITCVPLWDMVCQLSFMEDMRDQVNKTIRYDIRHRAALHKVMISHGNGLAEAIDEVKGSMIDPQLMTCPYEVATIDLKSASNKCTTELVKHLWPEHMKKFLCVLRTKVASYLDVDNNEIYHHFTMFGPMGTGLTFDVMTFTILALIKEDKFTSVFGDDIIVSKSGANRTIEILEKAGFIVNTNKSFTSGKFRESCGGMYHDELGYIVSYDIEYPSDIVDVINICNKLYAILAANQVSSKVRDALGRCRTSLLDSLPHVVKSGYETQVGDWFVYDPDHERPRSEKEQMMGEAWQRNVCLRTAFTRQSVDYDYISNDVYSYARFLYGGVKPAGKKTVVIQKSRCTWSGATWRSLGSST